MSQQTSPQMSLGWKVEVCKEELTQVCKEAGKKVYGPRETNQEEAGRIYQTLLGKPLNALNIPAKCPSTDAAVTQDLLGHRPVNCRFASPKTWALFPSNIITSRPVITILLQKTVKDASKMWQDLLTLVKRLLWLNIAYASCKFWLICQAM